MEAPILPGHERAQGRQWAALEGGRSAHHSDRAVRVTLGFLKKPVNIFVLLRAMSRGLPPPSALASDRDILQAVLGQALPGELTAADEQVLSLLEATCCDAADVLVGDRRAAPRPGGSQGRGEDMVELAWQYLEHEDCMRGWSRPGQGRPYKLEDFLDEHLLYHLNSPPPGGWPQGQERAARMEAKMLFLCNMALRLVRCSLGQLLPVSATAVGAVGTPKEALARGRGNPPEAKGCPSPNMLLLLWPSFCTFHVVLSCGCLPPVRWACRGRRITPRSWA